MVIYVIFLMDYFLTNFLIKQSSNVVVVVAFLPRVYDVGKIQATFQVNKRRITRDYTRPDINCRNT